MIKRNLIWFTFLLLTYSVILTAWWFGFFGLLLIHDITFLGFVVLALYIAGTICLGYRVFQLYQKNKPWPKSVERVDTEGWWFLSDQFLNLGLLGSLIGLLFVFSSLQALPPTFTVELVRPLITSVAAGVSTKLYTSVMGLAVSIMMKVQLWLLDNL